jgi:hypothetical protein
MAFFCIIRTGPGASPTGRHDGDQRRYHDQCPEGRINSTAQVRLAWPKSPDFGLGDVPQAPEFGRIRLLTPLESGGLAHYYRNNDDPSLPWIQTATFGTDLGNVDAASVVQSNFSTAGNGPGNLAVVARAGNSLVYFYRDDAQPFAWHGPEPIFVFVSGNPSLIQASPGSYGNMGDYEVVVPLVTGGIGHFYRNNDDSDLPWSGPFFFGGDRGTVDGVSLIQSSFSTTGNGPGNLAVVSVANNEVDYFYRDD